MSDDDTQMYYKVIGEDTCTTDCPKGQFEHADIDFECQQCSSECVDCETNATNCIQADGCNAGKFYENSSSECVASCENGFYGDATTTFCEECHAGCALCYASGETKCTECRPDPDDTSIIYFKK